MKSEIEVKFAGTNHDEIRRSLKTLGAQLVTPMRLMRRVTIDTEFMHKSNGFLRVRDEGDKVTITYKQFDSISLSGAKEINLVVNDYDDTVALFAAVGLPHQSYQESRRETWQLGSAEIVLDEWPWLEPFIEIEGESEQEVKDLAAKLGFDWSAAIFGDVNFVYQHRYPSIDAKNNEVGKLPIIKFGDPKPNILEEAKQ